MFHSLKTKLMLAMTLLVSLVIVTISYSVVKNQRQVTEQQAQRELVSLSELIATNTLSAVVFSDSAAAQQTLLGLKGRPDMQSAIIFDTRGELFARYQPDKKAAKPEPALISSLLAANQAYTELNKQGLTTYLPMISEGETVGLVYLAKNLHSLNTRLDHFYQIVFITALLAFIASFILIFWLQVMFTKPLHQLLSVIQNITQTKGYSQRAPRSNTLEFNQLAASFNAMLTEVDKRGQQLHAINLGLEEANQDLAYQVEERKKVVERLRLTSRVFSDTHEGITISNANKEIIDINPAFSEITGYRREEVLGKDLQMLSSDRQSPEFYVEMWKTIHDIGHWQGEVWNRKKSGELYAELLTISALLDESAHVINYVGVFSDITYSKQQQEKMMLMAHYDMLTGLPNRTLFSDRFQQAIAHSQRTQSLLAVCFIDLDNFKPVNDNFGHDIGDQLLVEVAQRITSCIRGVDTVSRQGGDEFALLLNDIGSATECELTLQRIHHSLSLPYLINGNSISVTASSGYTLYPTDDGDIDTLLRHADQAMYQSKLEGKHRYLAFNTAHDQEIVKKHHKLDEIEQALIHNELVLYYQPKINMVTGEVFGAEALLRWLHPKKGLIPPLDFLPILEGTALECLLGTWVINTALTQIEQWQAQDINLEISVNISSHHLQSEEFVSQLDQAFTQHPAVEPKSLQLEILESSALHNLEAINATIKYCHTVLGVTIALDDFGTGYSSLTHLRSLHVNTIKIDQTFVQDMLDDPNDAAIIDGVIRLSEAFNRDVIAEGVETTEHGLMLLSMGCSRAQGYAIAKPMPAEDFTTWYAQDYTSNKEWLYLANKKQSNKENKVKLYRLLSDRWKNKFMACIEASSEGSHIWPIADRRSCHCGSWIDREKQKKLFNEKSLQHLDEAHSEIHEIAHALQNLYLSGDLDAARAGLKDLRNAFDEMSVALGQC